MGDGKQRLAIPRYVCLLPVHIKDRIDRRGWGTSLSFYGQVGASLQLVYV